MSFTAKIVDWYHKNKRSLPWRKSKNPYHIWLSEIMLQQTRVEQGMPYYLKFTEAYPTVMHLASASEEEVLKMWQGLGYYSRARNLHATAKKVAFEMEGYFPDTYKGLLALKGVGDYTASAIGAFCFNLPTPVVDGNVYRLLSRYFGIEIPINSAQGVKHFKELAHQLIDKNDPGTYNQGIMEFGSIQCKPQSPDCTVCPLAEDCVAYATGQVNKLPVKIKNNAVRVRYFNYLVVSNKEDLLLEQRTQKDIWQHLYQFPLIESEKELSQKELRQHEAFKAIIGGSEYTIELFNRQSKIHKLSHQHIYTRFWLVTTTETLPDAVKRAKLRSYPMPVLIANFVEESGM